MVINYQIFKKYINPLPKIITLFAGAIFGLVSISLMLPVDPNNLISFFLVPVFSTLLGFLIGYYFGVIISEYFKCIINISQKLDGVIKEEKIN